MKKDFPTQSQVLLTGMRVGNFTEKGPNFIIYRFYCFQDGRDSTEKGTTILNGLQSTNV